MRTTPIDALKVGDWIALVDLIAEQPTNTFGFRVEAEFNGLPYKIIAIDLPFILVHGMPGKCAIDTRRFQVKRMSREYVKAAFRDCDRLRDTRRAVKPPAFAQPRRKREKPQEPDPRDCPRCGERMVQRQSKEEITGDVIWRYKCNYCGFDGERVLN